MVRDSGFRTGWPRAVARPGLPQTRTCAINAFGSSGYPFATPRDTDLRLADPNYNVVAITDASGDVLERYRYDAYGTPTVLNPNFIVRAGGTQYSWQHLFTTRRRDPATALMHYRNRDYHPQLGRFVTRDPIGYGGGSRSLYQYVGGTPGNGSDPTGLRHWGPPPKGWTDAQWRAFTTQLEQNGRACVLVGDGRQQCFTSDVDPNFLQNFLSNNPTIPETGPIPPETDPYRPPRMPPGGWPPPPPPPGAACEVQKYRDCLNAVALNTATQMQNVETAYEATMQTIDAETARLGKECETRFDRDDFGYHEKVFACKKMLWASAGLQKITALLMLEEARAATLLAHYVGEEECHKLYPEGWYYSRYPEFAPRN